MIQSPFFVNTRLRQDLPTKTEKSESIFLNWQFLEFASVSYNCSITSIIY